MSDRSKYRDNDDQRDFQQDRAGTAPDTKAEARGDAREAIGNNARNTAADPASSEWNDGQKQRPLPDEFDRDLGHGHNSRRFDNDEISES
jgi:hypothetical protein